MSKFTYKDAGVDLELNQEAMKKLPPLMQRTHTPRVMEMTGGFAGLFRLNHEGKGGYSNYQDPVLVSGTDGVGTKIKVAILMEKYDTIGIDLVAMCVNDCLCLGAEPLFFLDYVAMPEDNPQLLSELVTGISEGCVQSQAALLGGETAIMPDLYAAGDFDLAGFCVGVVERDRIIDGHNAIRPGHVLIGLASSGFHSNGYSLVRKIVFEGASLDVNERVEELGETVGDALLKPTRIYTAAVQAVMKHFSGRCAIHGMAHITGGGFSENIERILPDGCAVNINRNSWDAPPVFEWLQKLGDVDSTEMGRVFNLGIGYVMVVAPEDAEATLQILHQANTPAWQIGEIQAGNKSVTLK